MEKKKIILHINQVIEEKIKALQERFDDLNNDLASDHKSSAGDKHETGRAMTQLEQEKLSGQLNQLQQQKETLYKIDNSIHEKIQFGSLIITSKGIFFMSIGLGQIKVNNQIIFCISTSSPVGQLLLDKKAEDLVEFNGNKMIIEGIVVN